MPALLWLEKRGGVIASPAGAQDGDLVAALDQSQSHVGQVLRRGHDVGIKALVEEEDFQRSTSTILSRSACKAVMASCSVRAPQIATSNERWPELRWPAKMANRRWR